MFSWQTAHYSIPSEPGVAERLEVGGDELADEEDGEDAGENQIE